MKNPVIPENESERLLALKSYQIVDTLPINYRTGFFQYQTMVLAFPVIILKIYLPLSND